MKIVIVCLLITPFVCHYEWIRIEVCKEDTRGGAPLSFTFAKGGGQRGKVDVRKEGKESIYTTKGLSKDFKW
jgi:hypothetical protein